MADRYDEVEPHFRPENRAKVRRRLEGLAERTPSRDRMLDLGCGTGFLLSLAADLYGRLDGIDATPAMLARVDLSPGNITVQQGVVEDLPFDTDTFDLVTAYSFIDHLADHRPMLAEAWRVLRPGGWLYIDLIPNHEFFDAIHSLPPAPPKGYDAIVAREINELVNHEAKLQEHFGIEPADWRDAEPAKSGQKGFVADELRADATAVGFTEAATRFEWFLGQAVVMHGTSMEAAATVDEHLQRLLPASARLYKYLVLTARKP